MTWESSAGILRLLTFPGLWIASDALFNSDYSRLMSTLHSGLVSPDHAAFVQQLVAARHA